jgi:hypothetical protein
MALNKLEWESDENRAEQQAAGFDVLDVDAGARIL